MAEVDVNTFRNTLQKIWRLGDIELPIRKPWFALYWPILFLRGLIWPTCWEGWAAFIGIIVWLTGSVAVFIRMGWSANWLLGLWFTPTAVIWAGLVGVKTEVRQTPWKRG